MVYIPPSNFKPSKGLFYVLSALTIFFGIFISLYTTNEQKFGIWVIATGVLFLATGMLLIHTRKTRDSMFGVSCCPNCTEKCISINIKLKANWFRTNSHAKCPLCNTTLYAPIYLIPGRYIN